MTMMMMQPRDISKMENNMLCTRGQYNVIYKTPKRKFVVWETLFEVYDNYVPVEPLGRGAYGVVCHSINTKTNEQVAIKKISHIFVHVEQAIKALREMRILRHVCHPNVIGLKDVMITRSRVSFEDIYLVYELMDTDLHHVIYNNPLSNEHIKYFMFQLIKGLNYLHSANIIHRDLKPANVLVNANCDLKICDFGLSRTCENGQSRAMTLEVATRWYKAPELILSCDEYGAPVDVWAAGCIFAEMLGCKPLFPGKDIVDQLAKVLNILGTQQDPDLAFIRDSRTWTYIELNFNYIWAVSFQSLFPAADPLALDLLEKMLKFNPNKRITVPEILQHPYFSDLYDPELLHPAPSTCDLDDINASIGADKIRKMIWDEMALYHPEEVGD